MLKSNEEEIIDFCSSVVREEQQGEMSRQICEMSRLLVGGTTSTKAKSVTDAPAKRATYTS